MLNKKLDSRLIGILVFIPSILLFLLILFSFVFLFLFGIGSSMNILGLIPLILLSILFLSITIFGMYIGIRYIKYNGFKNNSLGTCLIYLGMGYFLYNTVIYILNNVTGNYGGEIRVLFGLLFIIILLPLGLGIRNGVKN